jgi:hypothetical protein
MSINQADLLSVSEFASLFGVPAEAVIAAVESQSQRRAANQAYFTIRLLAERWSCSSAQVYAVLRASAAKVVNIGEGKTHKKTLVPAEVVERLEKARLVRMR